MGRFGGIYFGDGKRAMLRKVVNYFASRSLLANFILLAVFIGSAFAWIKTSKEEMPNVDLDFLVITVSYPGASSEDVEELVTDPIESELSGISGIDKITSKSSDGVSSITVTLESDGYVLRETIAEIEDAVDNVDLPDEITDDPNIKRFKTSEKPVIDIGMYTTGERILTHESRKRLQTFALTLERKLLDLPEIVTVNKRGYLDRQLSVEIDPKKLIQYNITLDEVLTQIKTSHQRSPVGSLEDHLETKVTVLSEIEDIESLEKLPIRGGFEGNIVNLNRLAVIKETFADANSVRKVQGHEGLMLTVTKSAAHDIIESTQEVNKVVKSFAKQLKSQNVEIFTMDDESRSVKNRLLLVASNGTLGFALILFSLFLFLDLKSGIWVGVGIPFTLSFTMIYLYWAGYTVNNVTLAGVIIVMGMVVDDAIVVAENITRRKQQGVTVHNACVEGTTSVVKPVVASILTTCVAFLPIFFFSGRFGEFVRYIPIVIFCMLGASLFESVLVLPCHLNSRLNKDSSKESSHWFFKVEEQYARFLRLILPFRYIALVGFIALFVSSIYIFKNKFKFVMFPREETTTLFVKAKGPEGYNKYETAKLSEKIEDIILKDYGTNVEALVSNIGFNRRGGEANENFISMKVELFSTEERKESSKSIMKKWSKEFSKLEGFQEVGFRKMRFGQSSSSPIEILVSGNNDEERALASIDVKKALDKFEGILEAEIEEPLIKSSLNLALNYDALVKLEVSPTSLSKSLRSYLAGTTLYDFMYGDEEVDVVITANDSSKENIDDLMELRINNKKNFLVTLKDLVYLQKTEKPKSIDRINRSRTTTVYADLKNDAKTTPLEVSEYFERKVFPSVLSKYPTIHLSFEGEVKDTRESKQDFLWSGIMAIGMIFMILALLFNSLAKPFIILLAIPFGIVGVIFTLWAHGMTHFGFFSAIGSLGLSGVVVNDSIVMVDKLGKSLTQSLEEIARTASTRLRAVILTTLTTAVGLFPTAYGVLGYDSMLAEMMLTMAWGLVFGTCVTLLLVPILYSIHGDISRVAGKVLKKGK